MKTVKTFLILALTTGTLTAQTPISPTVDVVGEGVVKVIPDEVTINIRVENTGKTTKGLKEQNDKTISEVLKYLKSQGIADKDVRTEYINLSKNYDYNSKTHTFSANQALSVKLRSMEKYETVMQGLLETGINRIDGVSFSSSKIESLKSDARKKAVENAKSKAQEYASALNQTIGKAANISEFSPSVSPMPRYKMQMMDASANEMGPTIAPGEMEVKVNVNVSFFLY